MTSDNRKGNKESENKDEEGKPKTFRKGQKISNSKENGREAKTQKECGMNMHTLCIHLYICD